MEDKANLFIEDSNSNDFIEKVIEESKNKPVLVDFWAPWCGPCKQLTPVLEESIRSLAGKIKLIKINIDENQSLAQQLKIQSVPTVLAFFDGKPINGFTGLKNNNELSSFLKELLGPDVAIQKNVGLSIQTPGDSSSILHVHSDVQQNTLLDLFPQDKTPHQK